jgi:adenylate kinase
MNRTLKQKGCIIGMNKKLRLVVLGGPGSGKGTQGQVISQLLKLKHISTGEIFRDHIQRETELGLLARHYIDQGLLVPDEIATRLLKDILHKLRPDEGFILDGYPRSLPQAIVLRDLLQGQEKSLSAVFSLKVSDEEIVRRLSGRLLCRQCQRSFHLLFQPPARENICDHCGGTLYRRDDDNPETIHQRIRIFHEMTEPLIKFYQESDLLHEIDAEGLPADVKVRVEAAAQHLASTYTAS